MGQFDLNSVIDKINRFDQQEKFEQNIEIFLLILNKDKNEVYKQEAGDSTKSILFNAIKDELNTSRFKNRETIIYDTVISKKNVHEIVKVSEFQNILECLEKLNDEKNHLSSTDGLSEKNFHMYMVALRDSKHSYKIFGNFSNVMQLNKKFLFGNFTNSKIEFSNSDNIIGFNKKIDLLVIDDEYVLINQAESKFESLFKMNALFSTQATKILKDNSKIKEVFDDAMINRLIEKVKSGKRIATRLIKITSDSHRFNKTIENISKISEIIDNNEHPFHEKVKDVQYKDGKLSVSEGQEPQLLNAISDAFYHAIFSETDNVDESRM